MKFYSRRKDLLDEKMGEHFNLKRQGHRAKVSKQQMYEIRYRAEFEGWLPRKIAAHYGLDMRYVEQSVLNYRTMAGLVPVAGKPVLGSD